MIVKVTFGTTGGAIREEIYQTDLTKENLFRPQPPRKEKNQPTRLGLLTEETT